MMIAVLGLAVEIWLASSIDCFELSWYCMLYVAMLGVSDEPMLIR